MLDIKENYEMLVSDLGKNGEGIGRVDNFTLFVEGALPGDLVKVKPTKLKKTYGFAKLIKIIKPSSIRITPKCRVSKQCGGCALQEMEYKEQLKLKTKIVENDLIRLGGFKDIKVNKILGMEDPYYYRNKAQYAVGNDHLPFIGFYSAKTHYVVEADDCCIQHRDNKKILDCIKEYIIENKISIYDDATNKGTIRNIMLRLGHTSKEVMVCIIINANELPKQEALITKLSPLSGMKSIVVNINKDKSTTNFGKKTITIWGSDYITDSIENMNFEISPQSFFQVNPLQTKKLYQKALEFANISENDIVIDAYCGIGTISLFLAQKAKKVYGIEMIESTVNDAKRNAEINNISNTDFILGEAEIIIPALYEKENLSADIIVVDPPRKGCNEKLLSTILQMEPKKVIYISCDSATLARDLKILCQNKYEIKAIQPIDMFGMTMHVETVVLMSRVEK